MRQRTKRVIGGGGDPRHQAELGDAEAGVLQFLLQEHRYPPRGDAKIASRAGLHQRAGIGAKGFSGLFPGAHGSMHIHSL